MPFEGFMFVSGGLSLVWYGARLVWYLVVILLPLL